ncbi:hypothetical protein Tco_1567752 [Tanacetum coccineum]
MSNKAVENMSSEVAHSKTDLFLDDLVVGVTGTIVVMVCKIWDVNAVTGRYLSTDFVMCDANVRKLMHYCEYKICFRCSYSFLQGNVIHCTARANIAHNFIRETTIRKAYVKAGAFVRYPFQLQDIDNIEPRDNKCCRLCDKCRKDHSAENKIQDSRLLPRQWKVNAIV